MRLNIKQVEAFHRVFVAGGVTAAAHQLHISQPAVSRLIADLEAAVALRLFERRNRGLFPTPEGRMLFVEINKAFVGLENIESRAAEIREFRLGTVRVVAMPALSLSVLPSTIQKFTARYPGINISLNIRDSEAVFEWVTSDQMDFGIAALPVHKTVLDLELLPSPFSPCVIPRSSPLANRDVLTPRDLTDTPFISLLASSMLRRRIDAVFRAAGVRRHMTIETPFSLSAVQLVKKELGVAIVDPFTANAMSDETIIAKRFEPAVPYEFGLLIPGNSSLSRLSKNFIDILKQELSKF